MPFAFGAPLGYASQSVPGALLHVAPSLTEVSKLVARRSAIKSYDVVEMTLPPEVCVSTPRAVVPVSGSGSTKAEAESDD